MSYIRNDKGQFVLGGQNETVEEKEKRIKALREAQKRQPDYLGNLKLSPLYNCWRSFMFTSKGKKAGHSKSWSIFKNFYSDMVACYKTGLRLVRLDTHKPFSKENCMWMTNMEMAMFKKENILISYKGELKTLREWTTIFNVPYNAARQRLKFGFTGEEIIFGRARKTRKEIQDSAQYSYQRKRDKVSKMISSYKCSDKKKGLLCDLSIEWVLDNVISKVCTYCGTTINIGCDRIDNTKGHTKSNVIPACYTCNMIRKDDFSVEEMMLIGSVVREIKQKRNKNKQCSLNLKVA